MGIQGLLPQLKEIQNPVTLRRYEGQTIGIDGYAWLHRASCSCAYELALGKPTTKYLQFFIKKLSMLRSFKIQPYLVFDGDGIGVKKGTETKRREKREENRAIAQRLWNSGEKKGAFEYFQKCVDVTPEMAKCVIDYCKAQEISYVVAPFEADAQMVYLEKKGFIQGILSEDSDLLIFGCRCLITKLNDFGECIEICRDNFPRLPYKFALSKLSDQEIRTMVCLSGCDYTAGIPKVGLVTAMKFVQKFRTLERILLQIQREGKLKIPSDFLSEYELANFAFQYQRVFCPLKRKIVTLNEIPENLLKCEKLYQCIGNVIHKQTKMKQCVMADNDIHHEIHALIATGELNPYKYESKLINREKGLQLSSGSVGSDMNTSAENASKTAPPIDFFFQKLGTTSITEKKIQPTLSRENTESKIDVTVKRRKLSSTRSNTSESSGTSKFFVTRSISIEGKQNGVSESESELETDIPESEAFTEIPSSFVPLATAESSMSSTEEDDGDMLGAFEQNKNKKVEITTIQHQPRPNTRASGGSYNSLQRFRYSSSQEAVPEVVTRNPLISKDVNSCQRRPSIRTATSNLTKLNQIKTPAPPVRRPPIRSISSLSKFAYKG